MRRIGSQQSPIAVAKCVGALQSIKVIRRHRSNPAAAYDCQRLGNENFRTARTIDMSCFINTAGHVMTSGAGDARRRIRAGSTQMDCVCTNATGSRGGIAVQIGRRRRCAVTGGAILRTFNGCMALDTRRVRCAAVIMQAVTPATASHIPACRFNGVSVKCRRARIGPSRRMNNNRIRRRNRQIIFQITAR